MPENKLTQPISLPLPGVRWRGLTLRFFLWIILPLILLLMVGTVGSMLLHQREMLEMVGMLEARTTRRASTLLSEELSQRADAISRVSGFLEGKVVDSAVLMDISSLVPCLDEGIAVVSFDGEILAATEGFLAEAGSFHEAQQVINELEQEPAGISFSPVFDHPESGDSVFLVASPTGSAVLIGAVNLTAMMELWVGAIESSHPDVTIWLFTRPGDVLFRSQSHGDPDSLRVDLVEMQAEGKSFLVTRDGSGNHIVAHDEVDPTGWIVMIDEPWSAVASTTLSTTLITPMALAPVLILAVGALLYGARKIIQPLQALEMHARDLAWGDFQSIQDPVGGIEEIVHLQDTLIFLAEKVRTAQEGLRSYIGAITAGQEEERRRLARELHDETIQSLIALNQRAQLAQINATDSRTAEQLKDLEIMIQQTIQDLRRVTRALRPVYLDDLGLAAALDMLGREITESDKLAVSFKQLGGELRLAPEIELALFRIAQEALSNSVRHAQAHRASLSIVYSAEAVVLIVSDDGKGFNVPESPAAFAPGGHFGLLGMYERAELIRAQLDLQSEPGEGTRLTVSVSRDVDPG